MKKDDLVGHACSMTMGCICHVANVTYIFHPFGVKPFHGYSVADPANCQRANCENSRREGETDFPASEAGNSPIVKYDGALLQP
ncbi:MAG: hypothetical protein IT314_05725 [Anaerolineales bacterium]|nr:hypothetical protein [Anaerolineales bacterium]